MNGLGGKIRELRKSRGWTQNELAKRSGIGRSYISLLETDNLGKPSADYLVKLARAFNIRPEELYQAAGYIKNGRTAYRPIKEKSEEILERLRLAHPVSIPVYTEFPVHAGELIEPIEYIYRARPGPTKKNVEGYIARGNCLTPLIGDGDIIIVDREASIENGDIVACLIGDLFILGKLKQIGNQLWLENNNGTMRYEDFYISAVVIEVIRRLK